MRVLLFFLLTLAARAEPVRLQVFIALADNRTQGIIPVPAKIGNGDDAEANLYWSCSEALKPVLRASADWKLTGSGKNPSPDVLERTVSATGADAGSWSPMSIGARRSRHASPASLPRSRATGRASRRRSSCISGTTG